MDLGRVALRGVVGPLFIGHGTQKLFGWFGGGGLEGTSQGLHAMGFRPARTSAVLAGVGEAGAGLALALGLATPAAGAAAATTMGVHWTARRAFRRCMHATTRAGISRSAGANWPPVRLSPWHTAQCSA